MSRHREDRRRGFERNRVTGALVMGALTSGALAMGALGSAGEAHATCVAAGGWFSVGSGCTATNPGDFAIAIGTGATATASGGFNKAFAIGTGATAEAVGGRNNTAIAIGDAAEGSDPRQAARIETPQGTYARAGAPRDVQKISADGSVVVPSNNNTAIAIGSGAVAGAGDGNYNVARALGTTSRATAAGGDRNVALATGTDSRANAQGTRIAKPETLQATVAPIRGYNTAIANGEGATATATGLHNTAYARGVEASAEANGGHNNTAIAIGNPAASQEADNLKVAARRTSAVAGRSSAAQAERAAAVDPSDEPSNNTAVAIGDSSQARAGGGNGNVARVLGNRSRASATDGSNNIATVRGNDSQADAGQGDSNRARVFGNGSTAGAFGTRQRVTVRGDGAHESSERAEY